MKVVLFQSQFITSIIMIFFIKKNSSITLPEYRYLKEEKIPSQFIQILGNWLLHAFT